VVNRTLPSGLQERVWSYLTTDVPVQYDDDQKAAPLVSDSDYTWAVRWKDSTNRSSAWSKTTNFTTGLFLDSDWRGAEWIGMDGPSKASPFADSDEFYRFRKTVAIDHGKHGPVARCSIMIAGLGYYKLFVDGTAIDDHELGESTQFQQRIPYDAHACTSLLQSNSQPAHHESAAAGIKNVTIAVELGRGWYGEVLVGPLGNRPSGPRMLRFLLSMTYADGSTQYVTSSSRASDGWRRGKGPVVVENLHLGIVYDARRESPGWMTWAFDDADWILPRRIDFSGRNTRYGLPHIHRTYIP
jgi:alpha-L-rhamnosidase